ncbi:MAG: GvpL/GvpF family gas vesicle protein [Labilithrix sp.]|nr:GvpL/GvpF family gas vesicle protein [Labilithrix sp.]MBX3224221.1 GvpL/GvpF family gas vesicle protein [Labilithrix sp.]
MPALYLYALVDRSPRPAAALGRGIARRPLAVVRAGKAYVVVEPAAAPEPTPAALLAHDRVVRRIARLSPSILPLRFGSTAPDRPAVRALIAPLASALGPAFERVRGAVQFTLRVEGRRSPARRPPVTAGPGTRWLTERLSRVEAPEIDVVTEATRPYVRALRVERHARGRRIASVFHLVAREDVRAWRRALARAVGGLPRGVSLTATGPWPPWAFAELA